MRTLTNDTDFYVGVDGMVYSNGYEECEPGHFYGPAVRRSWLIHYITEGKGTFCCQGKCWKLTKGDLFFCRPGVEIEYHADQDDPWAYGWIGLQGTRMPEYFARTSLMETPVAHYDQDDQLALLFVKVQEAYKCPPEIRDLRLNSLLYSLLEFLVQTFPTAKASQVSNENGLWRNLSITSQPISIIRLSLPICAKNLVSAVPTVPGSFPLTREFPCATLSGNPKKAKPNGCLKPRICLFRSLPIPSAMKIRSTSPAFSARKQVSPAPNGARDSGSTPMKHRIRNFPDDDFSYISLYTAPIILAYHRILILLTSLSANPVYE